MAAPLGGRYDLFARLCPIISNLGLCRGALDSDSCETTATVWGAVACGICLGLKVWLEEATSCVVDIFCSPQRSPVSSLGSSVLSSTFLHLPFFPKLCVWMPVCLSTRYYITRCWLAAPLWCSDQHRKGLHHRLEGCRFCFVCRMEGQRWPPLLKHRRGHLLIWPLSFYCCLVFLFSLQKKICDVWPKQSSVFIQNVSR